MSKISYLIKRISKMSYKSLFDTAKEISEKTNKPYIWILIDIIYCGIKYEAGYVDYKLFEMYKLNKEERKTIVTRGKNNKIIKKFNNMKEAYKFEDKALFNKLYDKYLNRKWLLLDNNLEEFKNFVQDEKEIIVKPLSLSCGKGVEKIKIVKKDIEKLYNKLIENNQILVEQVAHQHEIISNVYPYAVNTVRIVTLNKKVVAAFIRFGNNKNVVDNFNHGGMVTTINIETGMVEFPAIDKSGNVYEVHPMTNTKIIGLKIPLWNKIKKLCIEACNITPEIGYIGWDVCVGEKKPCLIEGNDFPGHDLYQLPVHRHNGYGLMPILENAMKGETK